AIAHYEKSRDLYQQLEREQEVANLWDWLSDTYRVWGKYERALECRQQHLALNQKLENESNIAHAYYTLGRIYQDWGKYEEAIAHYEKSRDLYQQLEGEQDVANLWNWLSKTYRAWGKYEQALECCQQHLALNQKLENEPKIANAYYSLGLIYQDWGKYEEAIEYYQKGFERYQTLENNESAAIGLRQLSNTQRQQAKDLAREETIKLLQQAEQHLQQSIQLDTAGDYQENLAYDHISQALLIAESLRWLSKEDTSIPDRIAQFEQSYTTGFEHFIELGQEVNRAEAALDIARTYIEIEALENCDRAEEIANQSLQTFQDFNRCKLQASAHKLLGEIALKRANFERERIVNR
ncbi:MAG: tetratricopeptide repeat protein, partial [Spirulina sp.]